MTFEVDERPPRSIGFGLYYSTDEQGPGGSISWEHRNLFGSAESLRVRIDGSLVQQFAVADFRKPAFLQRDQSIIGNLRFDRNDTDAYEGVTGSGFAGIERQFLEHWTISAGPAFVYADIQRSAGTDVAGALSVNAEARGPVDKLTGSLRVLGSNIAYQDQRIDRLQLTVDARDVPSKSDGSLALDAATSLGPVTARSSFSMEGPDRLRIDHLVLTYAEALTVTAQLLVPFNSRPIVGTSRSAATIWRR